MSLLNQAVLETVNVSVKSASGNILIGVSLKIHERELVSIIGPSGGGKSTLLRTFNRLSDLESGLKVSGQVIYRNKDVRDYKNIDDLRHKIGLVFQKPCIFPGSILRNVLFGARHFRRFKSKKESLIFAEQILIQARLWNEVKDRLNRPASELSIGQKQRLAFGRVLAVDPDVLLLDEPTSSLDPHSTAEIEKALTEIKMKKAVQILSVNS